MIFTKLRLNVFGEPTPAIVHAKQGDSGTGGVIVQCVDGNGERVEPPSGSVAMIRVQKHDGKYADGSATIEADGTVKAVFSEQMLASPGPARADITVEDSDGTRFSTMNFMLIVEPAPSGNPNDSVNEYTTMSEAVNAALDAATSAAENAASVTRIYQHIIASDFNSLYEALIAGTEDTAELHLGFYFDANGDLCQVESTE